MAGYLGNAPTAVPLTSADITDGIITSAKIADGTIVNADINASAGIDSTKISGLSSDYVLLATTNITSSTASVSFDGYYSSTYKNYKVIISNLSPVSSTSIRFRFRRSNADVTATNYSGHVIEGFWREAASSGVGSSGQVWAGTNDYGWIAPNTLSGTNSQALQSEITIFDPLSTGYKKHISHITVFYSDSGYVTNLFGNYFVNDNNNAHSGITFYATSGNIVNGNFKLYGIK